MTDSDPPGAAPHVTHRAPRDRSEGRSSSTPPASGPVPPPEEEAKRVLPELIRKVVEAGLERLAEKPEGVRQRLGDLKLPKDALAALLTQIDEGKSGLYRAVAKELRDFLENTNFTEEFVRALTMLSFEIKTEIRLIPNDAGKARPQVKHNVRVRHDDGTAANAEPDLSETTNDPGKKNA